MKKQRKQYAPEKKVAILRRHLLEKEPISKLFAEMGLQPTIFYRWQKEFFENGAAAFEQKRPTNHSADQARIAYLQEDPEIILERATELRGSAAPDHLRQRAAVHCQGLQRIHSGVGHDPRQNFALLSSIERKNRTLATNR